MKTTTSPTLSTTLVNKSKFITYLISFTEFESIRSKLKDEHPKANHIVYAYRYLNELDQIVEASSDDGEPKGCAGVPALNVLRGEELINVAVFIVRYFGGIKLGTGGMARAYSKSVKDVMSEAKFIEYEKEIEYSFNSSFSDLNKILHTLNKIGITKIDKDFRSNGVFWKIEATKARLDSFKNESNQFLK
jgi:uncharacterized YigZ family protein